MKNRKGFTLIELIAVVVILGLVLIIAIPFFSGTLKTFRDDYYTNLNGNMMNAGKEFFQENRVYLPHKYLDSAIVDANTLTDEKILDVLKDYNGSKCEQLESYVIAIRKSKDEISYDSCIKCLDDNYDNFDEKEACSLAWKDGEGFTEVIFDKPEPVYIYKGTSRSELKKLVVAYPDVRRCLGKSGICEKEILRVSGKGEDGLAPIYPINLDTVNPDKLGTYNIKYKYENYGTTVDGKVIVYQNTAPTVNITKTNKIKEGTITSNDVTKTLAYDKNPNERNNWAQQLNFTFKYDFGTDAKPGLYVTRYQIFFNNRWEDYCIPAKGTNTCTKTETREMDEIVKFRSIDSEGHISTFTENIGLRIDRTKPSCSLRTDGTYGLRQWYITDVKISFQSKDDNYGTKPFPNANPVKSGESFSGVTLSQIKSNTYDYQKTDTNWITWYGYIEDKANNYQICNISFKRDATAPKCEFTIPAADGDDGWHKMPIVTVQFKTHTDTSGQPDYSGVEDYGIGSWNSGTKVVNHTADTASVTYNGEIRDMAGNKSTCKISFKKDSTVPQCVATRPEPDGDEDGGSKWHKMATVPVTIKSQSDNLSGVRNIGINSWNSGVKRVDHTADTNGITYTYQIRDIAGNMNTCSTWFKKDSTNPICELVIPGVDGDNGWHRMGTVKVEFKTHTDTSGQADYSGVRDYGINSWNSGTKVVNHTSNTGGVTYTGYIRDKAGNSSSCTTTFKKDSTDPSCTAKIPAPDGDLDGSSKWHKMGTVKVEINTYSDDLSGVRDYGISTWNSGTKVVNHTTDTAGTTYTYQIRDNAGNMSTCSVWFKKDSTLPSCSLSRPAADGDNGWHKMPILSVSFGSKSDNLSGLRYSGIVKSSSYGSSTPTSDRDQSINHTDDIASISYTGYVRDKAGNINTCDTSFKKDSTNPTCTAKVPAPDGDEDNGSKWHKMGTVKVETNTTGDNLSGVRDYGINSWNSGTKVVNHTADTNGITYTYQIRDNAGNMNTCSVWFKKDSTNPICEFTIPAADGDNGWHKMSTVKVQFKTHTDTSGQSNYSGVRDYGINSWNSGTKEVNHTADIASITYNGYIRDKAGNASTCNVTFKKDSTAPTCTAKVPAPDGDEDNGSKWHKMGTVNVEINTTNDNLSGIQNYGINTWNSGTKVVNHTADTAGTTYTYQVRDNAGNMNTCSVWFKKDSTQPQCGITLSGTMGKNNWYTSNVKYTISTHTDNLSGVRDYGYNTSSSGDKERTHTGDIATVTYTGYIKDKAGNTNTCSTSFKKDETKPTCGITLSGTMGDDNWYTSNVKYTISTHTDNLSGVMDYGYGTNARGDKERTHSADTASVNYTGYIEDNAGNMNSCTSATFKKDSTAPSCGVTTSGTSGNNGWYKKGTVSGSFTSHTDNLSGVRRYGFDSDSGSHTKSTTTSTEGTTWTGYIRDNAGNTNSCSTSFKFDNNAPTCVSSGGSTWTKNSVTLTGTCSDTGYSGCKENISKTYSSEINSSKETPGTVYDNAGNSVECPKDQTVQIDKTAPSCTNSGGSTWTTSSVTITGKCSENGSYRSGCTGKATKTYTDDINSTTESPGTVCDAAENCTTCSSDRTVQIDNTKPTCTASKSNTGTTSGVTTSVSCSDGGSGCKSDNPTGDTGLTESKTYTVYDKVGNSNTCTASISSQRQARTKSCSTGNSCVNTSCTSYSCNCETCYYTDDDHCTMWSSYLSYSYDNGISASNVFCYSNANKTYAENGCGTCQSSVCATQNGGGCKTFSCSARCTAHSSYSCKCKTCYNSCESTANCGCKTWGNYGSWSNVDSCSSGESSDHSTTTDCQTVYN